MSRPLPLVTPENAFFWRAGADGVLRFQRCEVCQRLRFPVAPVCPYCRSGQTAIAEVGGTAVVVGVTINHQQWTPGMAPPYVVAVVAIDEDPAIRLTTNLVGIEPDQVRLGLRVRAVFEQHEDVWLPLFEPTGEPDGEWSVPEPRGVVGPGGRRPSRPVRARLCHHRARHLGGGSTPHAAAAGPHHRGLPGGGERRRPHPRRHRRSFDLPGHRRWRALRGWGESPHRGPPTDPVWHNGAPEMPGQIGALVAAMLAVSAGLCRHVLCFRTVWEATHAQLVRAGRLAPPGGGRASGMMEGRAPFGAFSAANWIAMAASQHFARYGTTREHLGAIAVNARANAARNPLAVYREPLTLDDYLGRAPGLHPLRTVRLRRALRRCGGGGGLGPRRGADAARPAVLVDAVGTAISDRLSWDQGTLSHEPQVIGPATHLWTRTELGPADVDVAQLYDGFTFNCLSWLEALGFCAIGEGGPFVEGGARIALDGELPLNTGGGQLSAGRLHGFGLIHEAIVQLRGDGGDRQVPGAEVALVTTGGGTPGGCALLTVDR